MDRMSNTTLLNECQCGCGEPTPRRYRPGHDAKHKSAMAEAARNLDEGAIRQMIDMGWGRHCDGNLVDRVPQRNSHGQLTVHIDDPGMWFIDTLGLAHPSRRCRGQVGQIERWTIAHPRGWAICNECTHTMTYREEWEQAEVRRAYVTTGAQQRNGEVTTDTYTVTQLPTARPTGLAKRVQGRPGGRRAV